MSRTVRADTAGRGHSDGWPTEAGSPARIMACASFSNRRASPSLSATSRTSASRQPEEGPCSRARSRRARKALACVLA